MKCRTLFFAAAILPFAMLGCSDTVRQTSDGTTEPATAVAFNVDGAPTVEFSAPDMMCPESCAVKVKEILSEQPGAKEVVVDFDAKTATVAVEPGKFDPEAAVAALIDHGFDHSAIKSAGNDAQAKSPAEERPAG